VTGEQQLRGLAMCCGLNSNADREDITAALSTYIQTLQCENRELKKQVNPAFIEHVAALETRLAKSEKALEAIWKITVNTPSRAVEEISRGHAESEGVLP
jgi:hypothetical protein